MEMNNEFLMNALPIIMMVSFALFGLLIIGLIFARLYRRASKEVSFVRTGLGGQKVIMNGGALVLPVVHEIIPVNMNTLRLEVQRSDQQALITKDRMRIDVQAEFYVRVKPVVEAIGDAAQTLGHRTMDPDALKDLVEGKFVDSLRSVAAEMAMEELHEKRSDFVQKVQIAVSEDLLKNGLELETVSLTSLDQTKLEHLNPENAFDAQGLTVLTQQIESRRKERNDIEQDTQVQIQQKNLEAERLKLEIEKQEQEAKFEQQREIEYARLSQEQEVSMRRAQQQAEISQQNANKQQEAQEAEIAAKQQVDQARIQSEKAVEEESIKKDKLLQETEIQKNKSIEMATIEKQKLVELSEQDRAIAIAMKSKEQSEAQAQADLARAEAVKAEEAVTTAREKEQAERQKQVELVEASKEAEREAIGVKIAADAEKQAADDQATAITTLAEAEAAKVKISAEGDAEAEKVRSEAAKQRYAVEAEGKRAINEASNILAAEQIAMQLRIALIEKLPEIIRESVKPMEQIDGIKILQVDGLGNGALGSGSSENPSHNGSLADQLVNSALRYRGQAPLLDSLMSELGLTGGNLNGLTASVHSTDASTPSEKAASAEAQET